MGTVFLNAAAGAHAGDRGKRRAADLARASAIQQVLNIATSGDPGPLDPTPVTSDLLSEITQLFYETLYIFGPDFSIAPLLAAELPEISDGGKRYVIKLRSGVPYHDGTHDECRRRGRVAAALGAAVPARAHAVGVSRIDFGEGSGHVEIVLKQPYSPLVNLLAFPNGSPQIMPKRIATAPDPLKDFTGTGPFKLIEYKPDTWVRVGKFAQYVSPPGKPDGYVGKREALVDEVRFLPSPNPTTRADGLLAGQYHWADNLTPESYARIHGKPDVVPGTLTAALWVLFIMNNKKGVFSNRAAPSRRAGRDQLHAMRWRRRSATSRCGRCKVRSIRRAPPGSMPRRPATTRATPTRPRRC